MSHFTVLVIGDKIEEQLAPYDENMEMEPYKRRVDVPYLQELARSAQVRVPVDSDRPNPEDIAAVVRYYEEDAEQDEEGWYTWSTYNPDSKWDYWRIGGRWGGSFILKPGRQGYTAEIAWEKTFHDADNQIPAGHCDQALKGNIDFAAMDAEARAYAAQRWAAMEAAVAGLPMAESWDEVRARIPDIEAARDFYGGQPMVRALREARLESFSGPDEISDLKQDQEAYLDREVQQSWAPYAMLQKGVWQAPGKMGWFGMSNEAPDEYAAWCAEVRSVVINLPDDVLLTMCDLHI
jgi:hypothetical protein